MLGRYQRLCLYMYHVKSVSNTLFALRMLFGCLTVGCFLVILPVFFARVSTSVLVARKSRLTSGATVESQRKCGRPQMFKVCFCSYRRLYTNLSEVNFFRFCVTCVQKLLARKPSCLPRFQQQDRVSE